MIAPAVTFIVAAFCAYAGQLLGLGESGQAALGLIGIAATLLFNEVAL